MKNEKRMCENQEMVLVRLTRSHDDGCRCIQVICLLVNVYINTIYVQHRRLRRSFEGRASVSSQTSRLHNSSILGFEIASGAGRQLLKV